jgi:acyl carrier protein
MTDASIRAAVLDAVAKVAPEAVPASIRPDVPLRDQVDLDSMDFLNLVIELDAALGVDVPEADYGKLATVDSATDYLAARLRENAPRS